MSDYPDYQTFPNAQSDNLFTAFTQTLTPGLHIGTILPALSWSSLMLIVSPSAGAAKVTVNHFADAAGTQEIDSDTWGVNANVRLVVRTPLRSKYVRIDLNVTSTGNLTASSWSNFLSASSDRLSFPVSNQNASDFGHVLAASSSKTYTMGEICAGTSLFYFKPYDTTAKLAVVIHAVDELGVSGQLIADFGSPAATVQQLITVPDVIIQVQVQNADGAASHTYDFSLTVPPQ